MAAITSYKGEALVEASLFLEVHGFMPYIDSTEKNPLSIKSLYYTETGPRSPELAIKYLEKETEYSRNTKRALGAIKSTLSADNIDRFKDQPTANLLWAAIKATFGETSLETIARYFNKLIDASYESFKSADEYTSYELPKPFIAILLFKGLSSSFDAFITKSLYVDTMDKYPELRTELPRQNKKSRSNNTPEKTESTKAVIMTLASHGLISQETTSSQVYNRLSDQESSLVYNGLNNQESKFHKTQLILDSGASEHYTYNKDWLLDYKSISNKSIRANNNKLIIKDVFYIPDLRANLISTKELINKGWNIIFKKDLVEIVKNTIRVTAS
ncbi:hypothetical protein LCER1_G008262 [Lachnellula cervina]|uniref:Retrovirus-related Pol polyprotein from transposon TNT 1-94-like beta-barrel domain-containing protein n=1 Tax=Lachnellula cervina TaxID=1316786 RepID=A0A7D8YXH6_9HELO|nr:hypothetical protein LCER1_G008262 [Lachnellula cervina]